MIGKVYLLCKEMSPDIYHIPIEKDISVNSSMEDFIAESGRNGDECFCFCFAELFASLGLMSKNAFHGLRVIKYSKCLLIGTPKELAKGLKILEEAWRYWEFVSNVLDNYLIFFL